MAAASPVQPTRLREWRSGRSCGSFLPGVKKVSLQQENVLRTPSPLTRASNTQYSVLRGAGASPPAARAPATPSSVSNDASFAELDDERRQHGIQGWLELAWDLLEKYAYDFRKAFVSPILAIEVFALLIWGVLVHWSMLEYVELDTRTQVADVTLDALTMLGTLLFFLITFRTSQAYERWWEGRIVWGNWARASNDLVQQASVWLPDQKLVDRISRLTVAYAYLGKLSLRDEVDDVDQLEWEIGDLLKLQEIEFIHSLDVRKPSYCVEALRKCVMRGFAKDSQHHLQLGPVPVARLEDAPPNFWPTTMMAANAMEANLMELVNCLGTCNRIKTSPVPSIHTSVMRSFTLLYCFAIPFAKCASIGYSGVVFLVLFGWLALGVQDAADKLEQPFGHDDCDLPLDVFCEAIRTSVFDTYNRFHGRAEEDRAPWRLHEGPPEGELPSVNAGAMTMEAQMRALYDGRPQIEILLRQPSHRDSEGDDERTSFRTFKKAKSQQQESQTAHLKSMAQFVRQSTGQRKEAGGSALVSAAAAYTRAKSQHMHVLKAEEQRSCDSVLSAVALRSGEAGGSAAPTS